MCEDMVRTCVHVDEHSVHISCVCVVLWHMLGHACVSVYMYAKRLLSR